MRSNAEALDRLVPSDLDQVDATDMELVLAHLQRLVANLNAPLW
jgi:hypothetical protein